jgi:glycosyltransferase involved in cell wall biosynthesis
LRISVVIPAYNARAYIDETLAALKRQTRPADEVLLVDDGSTDDTAAFVATRHPWVQILRQENAGQSAARNRGVAAATGDAIAFLDADDVWLPKKLELQERILSSHPDTALVYAGWARPGGHVGAPRCQVRELHFLQVLYGYFLGPSGVVVRKDAFVQVGGFRRTFLGIEDRDLWSRIAQVGRVEMCWDVLWLYRWTPKLHADFRVRHWRNALILLHDMQPYVTEHYGAFAWQVLQAAQILRYRFYFERDKNTALVAECDAELAKVPEAARRHADRRIFRPYLRARLLRRLQGRETFRHEPLPSVRDLGVV